MSPTTHEEALVDLSIACAEGASGFADCAERAQLPALKSALGLRSEQCRHALEVLRALCGHVEAIAPTPQRAPTGGDARVFAQYEAIEGQVLSAFRDAIEHELPRRVGAALLAQFEIALNQYMQVVTLRPRLSSLSPVAPARTDGGARSRLSSLRTAAWDCA